MAKIGTILVVGGGVAGLATAAALHRRGFTTELVERQQTWHALGAGFLVHGNGMRWSERMELAIRALTLTTAAPSDLGAMNWRSIAPIRPGGLTTLQLHLGDGRMFGLVPMGAGRTHGFAYVVQPRFHDPLEGRLGRLRNRFATFGQRVQEYLASLERDEQVICSAMEWMESEKWHSAPIGRPAMLCDPALRIVDPPILPGGPVTPQQR